MEAERAARLLFLGLFIISLTIGLITGELTFPYLEGVMEFVLANKAVILTALLAVSEVLALIPGVKANGIFDAFFKVVKAAVGKSEPEA